jgi:hypothetical protein
MCCTIDAMRLVANPLTSPLAQRVGKKEQLQELIGPSPAARQPIES